MALWLVWAALAWGAPEDALTEGLRRLYLSAVDAEATGDRAAAEGGYRAVLRADERFIPARLGLARSLAERGERDAALALLEENAFDEEVVEARGRLLLEAGDGPGALASFLRLERLDSGSADALLLQSEALAMDDPERARARFEDWLGHPSVESLGEEGARVAVYIADSLRDAGSDRPARDFLARLAEVGDAAEHEMLAAKLDRYEVERAAMVLASGGSEALSFGARADLKAARQALLRGDQAGAIEMLGALRSAHPRSADVHLVWSLACEAKGDLQCAEEALVRAAELEPLEPRHLTERARLLTEKFGGSAATDVVPLLERAVRLRPGAGRLWTSLGDARWAAGDLDGAARAYSLALERGDDTVRGRARRSAPAPRMAALPTETSVELAVEEPLGIWVARVYLASGRLEEAEAEVSRLRAADFRGRGMSEVQAALAAARGDLPGAARLYAEALSENPQDARLLVAYGDVLLLLGRSEQAVDVLQRAASLPGGEGAWLPLARQSLGAGRPWEARERIERFLAVATGPEVALGEELRGDAERAVRQRTALYVASLGVLVAVPLGIQWRRRQDRSVDELLAAAPEAHRDLAPILAALRHEVLKHNASLLEPLADAVERGDDELVAWSVERLFGEGGVVARFREHAARIEALGSRYGHRVHLHRADPLFGPALDVLDRLERLRSALEDGSALGSTRAAEQLRQGAEVLNRRTYEGLGSLLARGSQVRIDDDLVARAWDAVQAEPARRDVDALPLEMSLEDNLLVRGGRADLHDILANLFRNALEAGATRVMVRTLVEEDWVTGLESVVVRIADDAPGRVTTAQIRSRFIDRGLGLVVDLSHRVGGSVSVVDESGYTKAIALTLPRSETPGASP